MAKGFLFVFLQSVETKKLLVFFVNRETKGGGIGIFYLSTLKLKNVCKNVTSNWEYGVFEMNFNAATFCLLCVYRIPGTSVKDFLSEFIDAVSQFMLEYKFFCILGDFNIPLNKPNPTASSFILCIEELNLVKHSSGSTHINGNELDVILSNDVNLVKTLTPITHLCRMLMAYYLIC